MKIRNRKLRDSLAVSEVIGTTLLMVISVIAFSAVYISLFSADVDENPPVVNIVGTIKDNSLLLEHRGGNTLPVDSSIILQTQAGDRTELIIKDSNVMTQQDIDDGKWNFGEKISYSLTGLNTFNRFEPLEVLVVDSESASLIMNGELQEARISNIAISMNVDMPNDPPEYTDIITFTIEVINEGPSENDEIIVKDLLPDGLTWQSHSASRGVYNPGTGLWDIGFLGVDSSDRSASVEISAKIEATSAELPFTQMAILIDGSDSIPDNYFTEVKNGIGQALRNGDIPNIGRVELSVFQFATSYELSVLRPKIVCHFSEVVTNDPTDPDGYYLDLANQIESISKFGGYSPGAQVIREAADTLRASINFDASNHIICDFISDCRPNMGYPYNNVPPPSNDAPYIPSLTDVIAMRNYFISTLEMTTTQDEIDALVIDGVYGHNHEAMRDLFVYPQPGEDWPTTERGWSRLVYTQGQVQDSLGFHFDLQQHSRTNTVSLINTLYADNDPTDNEVSIDILPVIP